MRNIQAASQAASCFSAAQSIPVRFGSVLRWRFLVAFGIVAVSAVAQEPRGRHEIRGSRQAPPSSAAIQKARGEILQVYSQSDVAARLTTLIHENQTQPARVYAIISMAADDYLSREQFLPALDCFRELSRRFDVALSTTALGAFESALAGIERITLLHKKCAASEALFLAVRSLSEELMAREDYAGADESCRLLEAVLKITKTARSKKMAEFSKSCAAVQDRLRSGREALGMVPAHELRLKASAEDHAAREFLGLYSCLYANDWKTGLDLLRKLESGNLLAAARADVNARTLLRLTGNDAYAVAKAWKEVSSDARLSDEESLWSAGLDSVLRRELEWLDRAIQLEIDNQIDRKLAWQRQHALRQMFGIDPHAIVGTWVVLSNQPGWKRTFGKDGQVVASHYSQGVVRGTWRPESSTRAEVQTEQRWKWVCTLDERNGQLLIEEFDPDNKKNFSIEHRRE